MRRVFLHQPTEGAKEDKAEKSDPKAIEDEHTEDGKADEGKSEKEGENGTEAEKKNASKVWLRCSPVVQGGRLDRMPRELRSGYGPLRGWST